MKFTDLQLIEPILRALQVEGYETPTPIQQQAIPIILSKKDLLGCAQTGTGKTAAFSLPILQLLHEQKNSNSWHNGVKTLILTPTRELAIQIGESMAAYGKFLKLRHHVIFGGVGQQPQVDGLRRGVDILIATPGRLLDLINQKLLSIANINFFVLDEADRMLDMGFIHDVKRVVAMIPKNRQTLFFSATMPAEIVNLANSMLVDPQEVSVTPVSSTAEKIAQEVYFVEKNDKRALLAHILQDGNITRALVFTRTKHGADRVARDLKKVGIAADAIHGDKAQNARQRALLNFKEHKIRILVATDIAARGIDVDDLTHVINFEIPNIPETYVHRIGRTGRAGASGIAISFCDEIEGEYLRDIQKLIGQKVPVIEQHPFAIPTPEILLRPAQPTRNQPVSKKKQGVNPTANRSNLLNGQKENVQRTLQNSNTQAPKTNFQKPIQQSAQTTEKNVEQRLKNTPTAQKSNLPAMQNAETPKRKPNRPPERTGKQLGNQKFLDRAMAPPLKIKPTPPVTRTPAENEASEAEKRKKRLASFGGLFKDKI